MKAAKPTAAVPILEFRARPSYNSRLFYTVKVYRTMREMRSTAPKGGRWFIARCTSWAPRRNKDLPRYEAGQLLFCMRYLDLDTVAHECFHASLGMIWRRSLSALGVKKLVVAENSKLEEEVAEGCGHMTQFVYDRVSQFYQSTNL